MAVGSRYNVESHDQSSEPKLTYLAYDGFSADYLSWRYQNRSGRTRPESLELENYVKSFDHQVAGIRASLK